MKTSLYVECIPATYIPPSQPQRFTYSWNIDEPPEVGQIVEIPLARKNVKGVVVVVHDQGTTFPYQTKPILEVFRHIPALPKQTLELAEYMSTYYMTPISLVMRTILPSHIPKRAAKEDFDGEKTRHRTTNKTPLTLSDEQERAVSAITAKQTSKAFLLHGPTGSGKTEVYLRAIQTILDRRQQVIVLVPEISLTPQAHDRYSERFGPDNVSVTHSNQTSSERFRAWSRFMTGRSNILIGPRSAILAPSPRLGLIIIDEAHERTYKQWDQHPRYDARTIARRLAELFSIPIVLGSATPRLEEIAQTSYLCAKKSAAPTLTRLALTTRIHERAMPEIHVVDMRNELRSRNTSPISLPLQEAIKKTLAHDKQALLFINRRGSATFVLCRDCGHVCECPNCSVPLVYHERTGRSQHVMVCHHCNHRQPAPRTCPSCQGLRIKFFGTGTERIETEIKLHFPLARIARMDRDTMTKRRDHEEAYRSFEQRKTDILIGTQMITKGWDIPSVDLVGIVAADALLHLPDFRSAERAFQLLTQVAGRCGRGQSRGEVIIQSYNPEHPVIEAVASYRDRAFYEEELRDRELFSYPPAVRCIFVSSEHKNKRNAQTTIERAAAALRSNPPPHTEILGPSPAFISKKSGMFRWNLLIKLSLDTNLAERNAYLDRLVNDHLSIDIDPETLLS